MSRRWTDNPIFHTGAQLLTDDALFFACRLPQYVYPSAAYLAAATGATPGMTIPMSPSPLSPTTGAPYFEYPGAAGLTAAAAAATQLPNGLEAAYPYTTAAGYVAPAGYSYAAIPPQIGHIAAYQPQQLQERMQ